MVSSGPSDRRSFLIADSACFSDSALGQDILQQLPLLLRMPISLVSNEIILLSPDPAARGEVPDGKVLSFDADFGIVPLFGLMQRDEPAAVLLTERLARTIGARAIQSSMKPNNKKAQSNPTLKRYMQALPACRCSQGPL